MLILDSHCDAPSQMYRGRDYSIDNPPYAQVDFPKMLRGGVSASFFALYIPPKLSGPDATSYARALLQAVRYQVFDPFNPSFFRNDSSARIAYLSRTRTDLKSNAADGRLSILLGLENGSAIQEDLSLLEEFYDAGVRYVTLAHNADNQICDSCAGSRTWGGLSPFGRELVREMNRIGMLIDVAHCSDETVRDCLELSKSPIVDTHCACRSLVPHRRNLPDDLMKGIAENGGVVGISIYPSFVSATFPAVVEASGIEAKDYLEDLWIADPHNESKFEAWNQVLGEYESLERPSISEVVRHIEHAVEICGADHVGIGTDYDGICVTPSGLEDISRLGSLFDVLPYSFTEIAGIAGENLLRLLPL